MFENINLYVFAVCLVISLIVLMYCYYQYHKSFKNHHNKIPCWEPEFLFGNIRQMGLDNGVTVADAFKKMQKKLNHDVYQVWLGSQHSIAFHTPKYAEYIYRNHHIYEMAPSTIDKLMYVFPMGLMTLTGEQWLKHSKIMIPALRKSQFCSSVPNMAQCTKRMIDKWKFEQLQQPQKKYLNKYIVTDMQSLVLDVIGVLFFNVDLGNVKNNTTELSRSISYILDTFSRIQLNLLPMWFWKLYLTFFDGKYKNAVHTFETSTKNLIQECRNRTNDSTSTNKNGYLLASLVDALNEKKLTVDEVIGELKLSIIAGFETTATALSWCIHYLSSHPDIQTKLRLEILIHMSRNEVVTAEIIEKCEYLECVMKETFRLAPIIAGTLRYVNQDDVVCGEIPVKKGDYVQVGIYTMNTDPNLWESPEEFIPERFLKQAFRNDDSSNKFDPNRLYCFGGGSRACTGQHLARLDFKVILATMMLHGVKFTAIDSQNVSGVQKVTVVPNNLCVEIDYVQ